MEPSFRAGTVLARSLEIWLKNLAPFLVLTLLITLPGHAFSYTVLTGGYTFADELSNQLVPLLVEGVLMHLVNGAICWSAYEALEGRPVSFARALGVGLMRLPAVLAVAVVVAIAVGLGFLLWIIPGLVLVSVLYVAVPAAVIERAGVAAAIQRSAKLTQGSRLGVFSLNAIFFAITYGAARLLMEAAGDGGSIFWTGHVAISTALGSFGAVAMTVAYQQLRTLKDGRTPEQAADIFR